jgi:1-deoxyxylulose-5-phosphate synthase
LCRAEGIAVTPWSPLGRGFLAGSKPREGAATVRARTDTYQETLGLGSDQDHAILDRVQTVARRLGATPAQVAMAWVFGVPGVTSPIVGASKPHHLGDALAALELNLDAETRSFLEEPYRPSAVTGHV